MSGRALGRLRILAGLVVPLLLALALAPGAQAQISLGNVDTDQFQRAAALDSGVKRDDATRSALHASGVAALKASEFGQAEGIFAQLVAKEPENADVNFLMGLSKFGLEKWGEAKTFLEASVLQDPARPEPKTRLGLTYIRLGDLASARRVQGDLTSLDAACKETCADTVWIREGLRTLGEGLTGAEALGGTSAQAGIDIIASASPAAAAAIDLSEPATFGMTVFGDPAKLYSALTQEGRCPPGKMAAPKQPCALILYERIDGEGPRVTFKPVFKVVSENTLWAIHDGQIKKIKVENLYFDEAVVTGRPTAKYRSLALIGNAENQQKCDAGLPCLSLVAAENMFLKYGRIPDSVVETLWELKRTDPGTRRVQ